MRDQKGKAKWLGAQLHWPSNSEGRQDQGRAVPLPLSPHNITREKKTKMQQTKQILAYMLEFLSTLIKLHIWKIANSINWKITRAQILGWCQKLKMQPTEVYWCVKCKFAFCFHLSHLQRTYVWVRAFKPSYIMYLAAWAAVGHTGPSQR